MIGLIKTLLGTKEDFYRVTSIRRWPERSLLSLRTNQIVQILPDAPSALHVQPQASYVRLPCHYGPAKTFTMRDAADHAVGPERTPVRRARHRDIREPEFSQRPMSAGPSRRKLGLTLRKGMTDSTRFVWMKLLFSSRSIRDGHDRTWIYLG
jgi:hypothetical protein